MGEKRERERQRERERERDGGGGRGEGKGDLGPEHGEDPLRHAAAVLRHPDRRPALIPVSGAAATHAPASRSGSPAVAAGCGRLGHGRPAAAHSPTAVASGK